MLVSPTLTAEEFKTIHNALWELDCATSKLENVLKPDLYNRLVKASKTIRGALKGAYDQESKTSDRKMDHYDQVKTELRLSSIWSIFEVANLNDRHPFQGANRVAYTTHSGERPVSCSVHGLTWAALYVAADACIRNSGDEHRVFIEQFTPDYSDPMTLILSTGS